MYGSEGSSSTEYDTKVTASFCLPRGKGFFLIASGNATRGSAFGRFTVSVTSREYYNMTLFSAGSDWTRGAAYDTDDIADVTALFIGSVVITEAVVTILSTEAPTFWSDTEENMEPVIVSRRQGGVAVSDLPACGCDDDTTA